MGKKKTGKGKKKAAGIKIKVKKAKDPDKQKTSATIFFWAVRVLKKVAKKPIEVSPQNLREVLAKSPHALATAAGKSAVLNALVLKREDLLHILVEAGAIVQSPGSPEDVDAVGSSTAALTFSTDSAVRTFLAKCASSKHNKLNDLLRDARSADGVKFLLDAGALPNYFGSYGCTAVHEAAYCGRTICLFILLQRGGISFTRSAEGRTPLHAAAIGGDKACVEVLIKAGVDVKAVDYCAMTALHFAAGGAQSAACVPLLLAAGADVNAKDKFDMTPLHYAAATGSAETVKALLDEGANRDAEDKWHRTPGHIVYAECDTRERKEARAAIYWLLNPEGGGDELMWENVEEDYFWDEEPLLPTSKQWQHDINMLRQLACFGDVSLQEVKALLNRSDPLVSSFSACKALQTCAEIGRLEIIKLFLKKGASPHIRESDFCSDEAFEPFVDPGYLTSSRNDWPLIHIAAAAGQVQTVETLLAAKASQKRVRVVEYADPFGPLEAAAANGHLAMVKYLLFCGCVTDREQLGGALRLAVTPEGWQMDRKDWVEETQTRIARTLLDAGADPNARDVFGHTPILGAAYCGWTKCLSLLIRRGSNVLIETPSGKTALHAAACGRHTNCVSLLINAGASISSIDSLGQTPLHYAAEGLTQGEWVRKQCSKDDGVETVKALINASVNIHCQDKNGVTALHLAAESGSIAVVEALLNAGALINAKDRNGRTPLHYAADAGADDVVDKLTKSGADTNAKDHSGCMPKSHAQLNSAPLLKSDLEGTLESEDGDKSERSWCGISTDDEWVEETSDDDTDDWELEYYRWVKELCKRSRDTIEGDEIVEIPSEQNAERKPNKDVDGQSEQDILLETVRDVQTESESDDSEEFEDIGKTIKNQEKIIELSMKWQLRGYVDSDTDFDSLMDEDAQHTFLPPGAVSESPKASWYNKLWIKGNRFNDKHSSQRPSEVKPQITNIRQPDRQTDCKDDSRLKDSSSRQSNFVQDTKVPLVKQERDSEKDETIKKEHEGYTKSERDETIKDEHVGNAKSERDETVKDEHEGYAEELRIKVELSDDNEGDSQNEDSHNEENVPYVSGAWTRPQQSEECVRDGNDWWNGAEPERWLGKGSPRILRLPDESHAACWRPEGNSNLIGREEEMEYRDKRRGSVWFRLGKRSSDGDSDSRHSSIVVTRILSENEEETLRYVQENSLDKWEARKRQEREVEEQVYGMRSRLVRESNGWEQCQGPELNSPDPQEGYGHSLRNEEGSIHQQAENVSLTERWVRESYESSERIVYVQDPNDNSELRHEPSVYDGQNRCRTSTVRGWNSEDSLGELRTGTKSNSFEAQERSWGRERHYGGLTDEGYRRERFESPGEGRRGFSDERDRGQGYRNVQTTHEENELTREKMQDTIGYLQGEAGNNCRDQETEGSSHMSLRTQGDDWGESRQYKGYNRDRSHGNYNQRSDIDSGDHNAARSDWEGQDLMGRDKRGKKLRSHENEVFERRTQRGFGDSHNRCERVSEERENQHFEYEDQLREQPHDCNRGLDARDRSHSDYTLSEQDHPRSHSQCSEREQSVLNRLGEPMHQDRLQRQYRNADVDEPCKLLQVQEHYLSEGMPGSQCIGNEEKSQGRLEESAYGRSQSPNSRYDEPDHYTSTSYSSHEYEKCSQTMRHDDRSHHQGRLEERAYGGSHSPNNRYDKNEHYRFTSYGIQQHEKDSQTRRHGDEGSHSQSRLKEHVYRRSRSPNSRYNEQEHYRSSYGKQEHKKNSQIRGLAYEGSYSQGKPEECAYRRSQSPSSRYNREHYRPTSYDRQHEKGSQKSRHADDGSRSPCRSRSRFTEREYGGESERECNQSGSRYSGEAREKFHIHYTARKRSHSRSRSPLGRLGEREHERSGRNNGRQDGKLYNGCRSREHPDDRSYASPHRRVSDDMRGRTLWENRDTECNRSRIQYTGSDERGFREPQTQRGWPDILKDVPH